MKILQLGKAYPPVNLGGVETTIQLITEGLHSEEINCDVLGVNDKYRSVADKTAFGVIYREALIKKAFSTLLSIALITRLYKIYNQYDIIHIHHPDPMSALALWLVRPKCKVVLHWHSDILRQKWLLKLYKPIQNWLLKRSDVIVATSPNYAKGSEDIKPYLDKVEIVPIGIDKSALHVDGEAVKEIKARYADKRIILAIGRMSYYKGYDYLIDAVKSFEKNCVLLIIGDGELFEAMKMKASISDNHIDIVFLGKVSDMERNSYLKACDLFVLSSVFKTEAFAIVQIEAMALGKPVVSTEIPGSGVSWVNEDKKSGLVVPIENGQALANAVNEIIVDADLYKSLSNGASSRFNSEFTQKIMIERLIKIYNSINI